MNTNKHKDVNEAGRGLVIENVLDTGSNTVSDVLKDSVTGAVSEVLVDSASSLAPGLFGAVQSYKRLRFERNMNVFAEEMETRIEEINANFETKNQEQKEKLDRLFHFILDYVIDEKQEEKIEFMVNGFIRLTEHDDLTDDFVLSYYDVLESLRMIDISVMRLAYRPFIYEQSEVMESYYDVLDKYDITYEQYEAVRRNLGRMGLLTTKTEINMTKDLEEISKRFNELYDYLDKLTNPKKNQRLPKLKEPRIRSKERFEISRFGRDFIDFFVESH